MKEVNNYPLETKVENNLLQLKIGDGRNGGVRRRVALRKQFNILHFVIKAASLYNEPNFFG